MHYTDHIPIAPIPHIQPHMRQFAKFSKAKNWVQVRTYFSPLFHPKQTVQSHNTPSSDLATVQIAQKS
jgi:hypothetical protein